MDVEAMSSICGEVQQHLLSKLGNLVAICLPEQLKVSACPWILTANAHCN